VIVPVARVLVADPDPDVLALVERAVASWGHETHRYRPGEDPPRPDVMLFEPEMGPGVLDLARRLAAAEPPVPLVVVSIHPPELAVHQLRPAAYLLKPFSLAQLEGALAKALRTEPR
jgi:CheY-like chemotaxis protein